jgi:hypothetical protein
VMSARRLSFSGSLLSSSRFLTVCIIHREY